MQQNMQYRLGLSAEPLDSTLDPRLLGVGLLRSEYLCRQIEEYVTLPTCRNHIGDYLRKVCSVFQPYEVWYRNTDLIVPEVNVLKGADHVFEEKHYINGLRGLRRAIKYPDAFQLELETVAEVAQEFNNLRMLFSFVYDPSEARKGIDYLRRAGYKGECGVMVEVPSAVVLLEEFAALNVSNFTVGVNDLTSLTLGTYRGSDYHDPCHPSILRSIQRAVEVGRKHRIPVSVAGYVTKRLALLCEEIGVDWFIVHYSDLPKVLDVAPAFLPHLNELAAIKKLTKSRIAERDQRLAQR